MKKIVLIVTVLASISSSALAEPTLTGRWAETLHPSQLVFDYPETEQQLNGKTLRIPAKKIDFLVVATLGTRCPLALKSVEELNEVQELFKEKGVQVIGLFPNTFADIASIANFALHSEASFPVFKDDVDNSWAMDELEMTITPEVVVIDVRSGFEKRHIVYRGSIHDALMISGHRAQVRTNYLRDALEAAVDSNPDAKFSVPNAKAQGCKISRRPPKRTDKEVEYYPTIAKIIQKRCQSCHRPGELGAETYMAFMDYDDVYSVSDTIMDRVRSGVMPPWQASLTKEGHELLGGFKDDVRLTKEEKQALEDWYEGGMEMGDPTKAPQEIDWPAPGTWGIGKPDFVYEMPEPFVVPKKQWDGLKYYYLDADFPEDRYVQAVEMRPGNRNVVHHMGALLGPCPDKELQGVEATAHFYGLAGDTIKKLGDWVPGDNFNSRKYPENTGLKIPKNNCIVLEMHYTPTGREEKPDVSSLALIFHDRKPEIVIDTKVENNKKIRIRPYDGHSRVSDRYWFKDDVKILTLAPHMHYRGKDYTLYKVENPGQANEVRTRVFEVSAYDFRWQRTYEFEKPLELKAGDLLEAVGHFDNSYYNPNNPKPDHHVVFGLESEFEMFNTRFKFLEEDIDEEKI